MINSRRNYGYGYWLYTTTKKLLKLVSIHVDKQIIPKLNVYTVWVFYLYFRISKTSMYFCIIYYVFTLTSRWSLFSLYKSVTITLLRKNEYLCCFVDIGKWQMFSARMQLNVIKWTLRIFFLFPYSLFKFNARY